MGRLAVGVVRPWLFVPLMAGLVVAGAQTAGASTTELVTSFVEPAGAQLAHAPMINAAAFSPAGTLVAAGNADGTLRVWSVASGRQLALFDEPRCRGSNCSNAITSVSFSPDGSHLLSSSDDGTARIWQLGHARALVVMREPPCKASCAGVGNAMNSAAYSPDGSMVVTTSNDGTVRIWNSWDGHSVRSIDLLDLGTGAEPASDATFSPDGQQLATAGQDDVVRTFSLRGTHEGVYTEPGGPNVTSGFTAVRFSPSGSLLAASSDDGTTLVWPVAGGAAPISLAEPPCRQADCTESQTSDNGISFSPDGNEIVTASNDGTARVWELPTAQPVVVLRPGGAVASVDFSPRGGAVLTAGTMGSARIYAVPSGEPGPTFTVMARQLNTAAPNPQGNEIVTASNDGSLRVLSTRRHQQLLLLRFSSPVSSASFDPSGRHVLAVVGDTVRVFDARSGEGQLSITIPDGVNSAAYDPDGREIVTASPDGTARIFSAVNGSLLQVLREPTCPGGCGRAVNQAVFSGPETVVTASDDGTARVFDVTIGRPVAVLAVPQEHSELATVTGVAASDVSNRVVTVGDDGAVIGWRAQPAHRLWELSPTSAPTVVAMDPEGQEAAIGLANGTVQLVRTSDGAKTATFFVGGSVNGVSLSDHLVAAATSNGRASLWRW